MLKGVVRARIFLAAIARGELAGIRFLAAIEQANAMLNGRSHHAAVELWLDNKCAYPAGRDQAAA